MYNIDIIHGRCENVILILNVPKKRNKSFNLSRVIFVKSFNMRNDNIKTMQCLLPFISIFSDQLK